MASSSMRKMKGFEIQPRHICTPRKRASADMHDKSQRAEKVPGKL